MKEWQISLSASSHAADDNVSDGFRLFLSRIVSQCFSLNLVNVLSFLEQETFALIAQF